MAKRPPPGNPEGGKGKMYISGGGPGGLVMYIMVYVVTEYTCTCILIYSTVTTPAVNAQLLALNRHLAQTL